MNVDDMYSFIGYTLIVILVFLIFRTLFPKKENNVEGFMGLFEETKTDDDSETKNDADDPAVKRIEHFVEDLQNSTNKVVEKMNLVKYRSHWENLIIAMEDRISSTSLQSLTVLSGMIKQNPNDPKIVTAIEKLNTFTRFKETLKENMTYLDGLK